MTAESSDTKKTPKKAPAKKAAPRKRAPRKTKPKSLGEVATRALDDIAVQQPEFYAQSILDWVLKDADGQILDAADELNVADHRFLRPLQHPDRAAERHQVFMATYGYPDPPLDRPLVLEGDSDDKAYFTYLDYAEFLEEHGLSHLSDARAYYPPTHEEILAIREQEKRLGDWLDAEAAYEAGKGSPWSRFWGRVFGKK